MKNNIMVMGALLMCTEIFAQSQGSIEQYYYLRKYEALTVGPILSFNSKNNWYAEARYNYEDVNTFSLYGGRTFVKDGDLFLSATPMVGMVAGNYKGASAALNLEATVLDFCFESQSQYTISSKYNSDDFYFNWSELTYQPFDWMYAGIAAQYTYFPVLTEDQMEPHLMEVGPVIGFSFKQWNFPFYFLNPVSESHLFIAGISWTWERE